jgi:hypothetical protein
LGNKDIGDATGKHPGKEHYGERKPRSPMFY